MFEAIVVSIMIGIVVVGFIFVAAFLVALTSQNRFEAYSRMIDRFWDKVSR